LSLVGTFAVTVMDLEVSYKEHSRKLYLHSKWSANYV